MKNFAFILTLCAAFMIGCGDTKSDSDYTSFDETTKSDGSHGGHSHAHEKGPHGGKILELSSNHEYHGELCMDEGGKSLTFYVLGGDIKTPVPADSIEFEVDKEDGEEAELPSTPKPLEGEADGKSSVYSIDISSLGEVDLDHFAAHVHVMVDGKELEGGLKHDHDHGHEEGAHGDHDKGSHAEDGDKGHKHEGGDKDEHHAEGHDKKEGHDKDGEDHKKEGEEGHK